MRQHRIRRTPEGTKKVTHVESGKLWQLTETAGLN